MFYSLKSIVKTMLYTTPHYHLKHKKRFQKHEVLTLAINNFTSFLTSATKAMKSHCLGYEYLDSPGKDDQIMSPERF